VYSAFRGITCLTRSMADSAQGYPAISPRLGPPEQKRVYESGYASSAGSATKRKRDDMEGA
jgi:hypothetical protein